MENRNSGRGGSRSRASVLCSYALKAIAVIVLGIATYRDPVHATLYIPAIIFVATSHKLLTH